jgi:type IV pilus assembly protein PilA
VSRQQQKGFTLIELMIVVTVVGMLAASAIPQYQDYLIRAQVTEGLGLAHGVETALADYYNINGTWPSALTGGGTALSYSGAVSGRTVSNVASAGGGITISYGLKAHANLTGKTLGINVATTAAGNLLWLCGNAVAPTGATAVGTAITNVPSKYLPKNCQ